MNDKKQEQEQWRLVTSLYHAVRIAYGGKSQVVCSHCGDQKELPIFPLAPIIVCQCERCQGYTVPFAGHLLGLPKNVIESGSEPDIKWAIEQVIMNLLHRGVKQLLAYKIEEPTMELEVDSSETPEYFEDLEKLWGESDVSDS